MKYLSVLLVLISSLAQAQVDTINTATLKINLSAFKNSKRSYAVFFEDSTGKRLTSADIWDRTIRLSQTPSGQKIYEFDWKWFQKDSLLGHVTATGQLPSLAPLTHKADYAKRGKISTTFTGNNVAVSMPNRKTGQDTTFTVTLKQPAFEFPMDLEILPLLPIKKVGQQFAVAFYEPGTPAANYYRLTVTGKEDLPIGGNTNINCWLLKIDYGRPDAHATFWISDQSREVIKMREYFRGRYRYKVKLF